MSSYAVIKNKFGRIIVNRNQCVYCPDFRFCQYRLWYGKPADCPMDEQQKIERRLPIE